MAYSALPAKIASDTLNLGDYNAIKGNFEAGVPDIFSAKGDLAAATGANAATRLAVGANDSTLVPDSGESGGLAWQIQPTCRVINESDIDPATSTWVTVDFDAERYDTDGMHSVVSNTSRLTAPSGGGGHYIIGANVKFDSSLAGAGEHFEGARIVINGATTIAQEMRTISTGGTDYDGVISLVTEYWLSVTDYVELEVWTTYDCDVLYEVDFSPILWASWQRRL
jgi:hypothetical protein